MGDENEESFRDLINNLKKRKKNIIKILEKDVISYWRENNGGFEIIIDKSLPISNLLFKFENEKPKWIVLDTNYNETVYSNDIFFYPDKNFKIK